MIISHYLQTSLFINMIDNVEYLLLFVKSVPNLLIMQMGTGLKCELLGRALFLL